MADVQEPADSDCALADLEKRTEVGLKLVYLVSF